MKNSIRDGALLIGLVMALSVVLAKDIKAQDVSPEIAFGANSLAVTESLDSVRGMGSDNETMNQLLSATMANNRRAINYSPTIRNLIRWGN